MTTPKTSKGTTRSDFIPARPIRTPSVSNPQTTSAISLVKSGTRSGKNCGRFGIWRSPFPGRFGLGRTRKSSFLNWPDWAITHLAQRLFLNCRKRFSTFKMPLVTVYFIQACFDNFPCIVFLLSDNKAFFLLEFFSLIHFVEYSVARFLGPRFLFLCVALGKSIEICHIHFESDQPNYNPKSGAAALVQWDGGISNAGRLVSYDRHEKITHPITNIDLGISIIENLHLRNLHLRPTFDPKFRIFLWCLLKNWKFFNLVRYHKLFFIFLVLSLFFF